MLSGVIMLYGDNKYQIWHKNWPITTTYEYDDYIGLQRLKIKVCSCTYVGTRRRSRDL